MDYARRMAAKVGPGVAKPDMQARSCARRSRETLGPYVCARPWPQVCKEMRAAGGLAVVWGHVPGVPVGAKFAGRGELAACGVHVQIMCGIDCRARQPATCVVVGGGYGDDVDEGDTIQYTGQGGQCSSTKRQITDQRLERGNAALALNAALRCPVRVVRGALEPDGKRSYVYDGASPVMDMSPPACSSVLTHATIHSASRRAVRGSEV